MLWRLLCSFSRGVRSPCGGALTGLYRSRLQEGESLLLSPESTQLQADHRHGKQQHKTFGNKNFFQCYTPLEAFTWSALAALALELTRQAHWLSSVQPDGRNTRVCQPDSQISSLSQYQHSVTALSPCSTEEDQQFLGVVSGHNAKKPSSSRISQPRQCQHSSETERFSPPNIDLDPNSCLLNLKDNSEEEESVKKAASQVQDVFQASILMASNILGLENMEAEKYNMAFSYFKLAADQNYSKAQYNVGLCYEHGRGTTKNLAKAILYYQRAAHQGHIQAQYRYVKWLLFCWHRADLQKWKHLSLAKKTCLSSPCLQSLDQPLSTNLRQPTVGLHRPWSTGCLQDVADSCELQTSLGFPDILSCHQESLPISSGIAVG